MSDRDISKLAGPVTVSAFAAFQRSVRSLPLAVDFYCGALGFELEGRLLRLGSETVELLQDPAGTAVRLPTPSGQIGTAFQHIAIVTNDMPAAMRRLAGFDFSPITRGSPVTLPASAGGVTAFKFRDPDGHPLELISFPPGTGDPRWQVPALLAGPTLGIDHSAIVVADVEPSIAFYTGRLSFTLSARQTNRGPEQDRLDGLDGVEVDVIALQPADATTPHLELLGYRSPRPTPNQQPSPLDTIEPHGAGDTVMWWVRAGHDPLDAESVRDPDGHQHLLHAAPGVL